MQEYTEVKEQKSRLMLELEQEKKKLEEDILKLSRNKVRQYANHLQVATKHLLFLVSLVS